MTVHETVNKNKKYISNSNQNNILNDKRFPGDDDDGDHDIDNGNTMEVNEKNKYGIY